MKQRVVVEIVTDTYEEEQYILSKFPESFWIYCGGKCKFFLPINKEDEIKEAINEWKELQK